MNMLKLLIAGALALAVSACSHSRGLENMITKREPGQSVEEFRPKDLQEADVARKAAPAPRPTARQ